MSRVKYGQGTAIWNFKVFWPIFDKIFKFILIDLNWLYNILYGRFMHLRVIFEYFRAVGAIKNFWRICISAFWGFQTDFPQNIHNDFKRIEWL